MLTCLALLVAGLAAIVLWFWTPILQLRFLGPVKPWPEVESAPLTTPDSDPLPPGARVRLGRERLRQGSAPALLAFSPDGKLLASVEPLWWSSFKPDPFVIHLWESATGQAIRRLETPSRVWSVVFSADGNTVSAIGYFGLRVWEVSTGKELQQLPPPWGEPEQSPAAVLSADAKTMAWTVRSRLPIHLCDTATGQEVRQLSDEAAGGRSYENLLGFTADGQVLISAPYHIDTAIRVWDVPTGKEIRELPGFTGLLDKRCFTADGKRLVTWHPTGVIRIWDVDTVQVVRELPVAGPNESYSCVALSADGKTVAAGFGQLEGHIRWWDTATGKQLGQVRAHPPYMGTLAFSPDGKVLASAAGGDGAIQLWDVASGAKRSPREGHQAGVASLSIAPDGKTVATVARDHTLRLWDPTTGAELRRFRTNGSAAAFSPDGKTLAVSRFYTDQRFPLLDAATGQTLREFPLGKILQVRTLAFSPDGAKLAASSNGEVNYLWDVASGKVLREFRGAKGSRIWSVAFSADSTLLAVSADEAIEVRDLRRNQLLCRFGPAIERKGWLQGFSSLAFSPDGKLLAAADGVNIGMDNDAPARDGVIRVYDVASGEEQFVLKGHRNLVSSVSFSPDGKLLASGGEDRTVRLWDAATGKELHCFEGHRGAVTAVAFAPDGRAVLSGSLDSTALVWDVTPFAER